MSDGTTTLAQYVLDCSFGPDVKTERVDPFDEIERGPALITLAPGDEPDELCGFTDMYRPEDIQEPLGWQGWAIHMTHHFAERGAMPFPPLGVALVVMTTAFQPKRALFCQIATVGGGKVEAYLVEGETEACQGRPLTLNEESSELADMWSGLLDTCWEFLASAQEAMRQKEAG